MNIELFQNLTLEENQVKLLDALKEKFGISKISPKVHPYLFGKGPYPGLFGVRAFEDVYQQYWTYNELFGLDTFQDEIFPAVQIGGDGLGNDFWLVLATGAVISLHHDATFYEVASDISAAKSSSFVKQFIKAGSALDIGQLLDVQEATNTLPKGFVGRQFFQLIARCLGWKYKKLAKAMLEKNAFEFLFARCCGFLENGELDVLIKSEKKVAKAQKLLTTGKSNQKIDLSDCFLSQLPPFLADVEALAVLDLSNNPQADLSLLPGLSVDTLLLESCQLKQVPTLPKSLTRICLSANPLEDFEELYDLPLLRFVELIDVHLAEEKLESLEQALPHCKWIRSSPFEREETTLSLRIEDIGSRIHFFKQLEEIHIRRYSSVKLDKILKRALPVASTLRRIDADEGCKKLPEELVQYQALEYLHMVGGVENIAESYGYMAQLPNLKNFRPFPEGRFGVPGGWESFWEYIPQFSHITELNLSHSPFTPFQEMEQIREQWAAVDKAFPNLQKLELESIKKLFEVLKDYRYEKITHLVLSGKWNGLDSFPEDLSMFPNVTDFRATLDEEAQGFPEGLSQLKKLRKLNLSVHVDEKLFVVPDNLADLTELEELTIFGKVGTFPEELGEKLRLKKLYVSGQIDVEMIVPAVSNIRTLRELNLWMGQPGDFAPTREIPSSIGQLQELRSLTLSLATIRSIPDAITELVHLERFSLSAKVERGCEHCLLPEASKMQKLQHLQHFSLYLSEEHKAHAEAYLVRLAALPKLKTLELTLTLESAPSLPDAFLQCTELEELTLKLFAKDQDPHRWLDQLHQLPNLKKLKIYGESAWLEQVPTSLHLYKSLEDLTLGITKMSDEDMDKTLLALGQMTKLRKLNLLWGSMPNASIKHLKNIEELALPNREFPSELLGLTQLRVLNGWFPGGKSNLRKLEKALPHCVINVLWD